MHDANRNASRNDSRPRVPWITVKTFVDEKQLAVNVQKLDLQRPRYSFEIGWMRDGDFRRHFQPWITTRNAQVDLTPLDSQALARLIAQAEQFIQGELQAVEDRYADTRIDREEKQANQHKQETRRTGKTQRDRDKRKRRREDANEAQ